MSRLIDVDKIEYHGGVVEFACKAIIDEQPTVDAERVVRCKDCKYHDWDCEEEDALVCTRTNDGFWYSGNDFCSHGVKMDEVTSCHG